MKTAREYISEIVTNKSNLQHIAEYGKINGSLLVDLENVMKQYANGKLDAAAEEVEIHKVVAYPNFPKVFVEKFKTKTGSAFGIVETLQIDKESILSLKDEI